MIKFYYNNLVNDCALDSTSQNAQFPLNNIKDQRRTKVFRSTSNTDDVIFDFGESSEIDTIILNDNPQDGFGFNTIEASLSESPAFTPDLLEEMLYFNSTIGIGINKFDEIQSRYARLSMDSSLGYCELSNVFIGKEMELIDGKSINFGWTQRVNELINKSSNEFGQQFSDLITTQREFNVSFTNLTKDQKEQLDKMTDYVGTFKPFWVAIGCPDIENTLERLQAMVFLTAKPQFTNTFFNRYQTSLTFREAK